MNVNKPLLMALAFVATAPVTAAEAAWPKNSAADLSLFVTLLRYQIYADHCSVQFPHLKPRFEGLVEDLHSRLQGVSKGLLASTAFKGMRDVPVPVEIIDAFRDSFDDLRHNVERRDAGSVCPEALQSLDAVDDETLRSGLTQSLTAIQNMSRNLQRDRPR